MPILRRGAVGYEENLQKIWDWHHRLRGFLSTNLVSSSFGRSEVPAQLGWADFLLRVSQDQSQGIGRSELLSRGSGRNFHSRVIQVVDWIHCLVIAGPISLLAASWGPPLTPEVSFWFLTIGPSVSEPMLPYTSLNIHM